MAAPVRARNMRNGTAQRGFALIVALMLLAGLSGVALDQMVRQRARRVAAANIIEHQKACAAARAGIEHARAILGDWVARDLPASSWNRALRGGYEIGTVALSPDHSYRMRIDDAASRLSLNAATGEQLVALFRSVGVAPARADSLSQAIQDWRDSDELHRPRGAEGPDYYEHLVPPVRPANRDFRNIGELREVRGMTPELYRRVGRNLSTAATAQVNVNTAPSAVLRSLPGMSDEAVAVVEQFRHAGLEIRNLFDLQGRLPPPAAEHVRRNFDRLSRVVAFDPREILVRVEGHDPSAGHTCTSSATLTRSRSSVQPVSGGGGRVRQR